MAKQKRQYPGVFQVKINGKVGCPLQIIEIKIQLSPDHFQKPDRIAHDLLKNKRHWRKVFHLMLFLEVG